jgi:hypothetical protein
LESDFTFAESQLTHAPGVGAVERLFITTAMDSTTSQELDFALQNIVSTIASCT